MCKITPIQNDSGVVPSISVLQGNPECFPKCSVGKKYSNPKEVRRGSDALVLQSESVIFLKCSARRAKNAEFEKREELFLIFIANLYKGAFSSGSAGYFRSGLNACESIKALSAKNSLVITQTVCLRGFACLQGFEEKAHCTSFLTTNRTEKRCFSESRKAPF